MSRSTCLPIWKLFTRTCNRPRYVRSFALSGELETDAIDANLKDGVLTLRIPKRGEYRPCKIEVRTE